eukprot:scaffold8637_cov153-Skeletonema_dohrnii-CCMP3373.AAC.14
MSAVDAMANLSSPSVAPTTGMSAVAVDRPSDNESDSASSRSDGKSDEDYSPNQSIDDPTDHFLKKDDEDFIDSLELEEIMDIFVSSKLEANLDSDDSDSKVPPNNEVVDNVNTASFDMREGGFQQRYDELANSDKTEHDGLLRAIIHLVTLVEKGDFSKYSKTNIKELEDYLNMERGDIYQVMKETLIENGYKELAEQINLGSRLSILTLVVFFLHYAPTGCKPVDGDPPNFARPNQCCIATLFSKVPNFFLNEQSEGSDFMEEQNWRFGGKTDFHDESKMAVVDLMPILLEKKESEAEMVDQYSDIARKFGLDSYYDLMAIPYCLMKMHILLFEKNKGTTGQRIQVHVASSSTAKQVFGFTQGMAMAKYRYKLIGRFFVLTFGFHPQGLLMGIAKNSKVYHKALLKIMTKHLIDVYSSVYPRLRDLQDSRIFEIFGSDHSSIEMGMYSRTAKELDEKGLLNLDTNLEANADAEAVRVLLLERDVSIGVISFFLKEMEGASTLSLIMDRMRRFRASQRLPYIASLLPKDVTSLDSLSAELKCNIDAISSTLKKPTERVFQSLLKYQSAQHKMALLHRLAKKYNNAEGEEDGLALEDGRDAAASLWDDEDFNTYCRIANLDRAVAIQKVKNMATAQDKMALLYRLAKKYNNAEGEEDGLALEDGRDAAASLWDDEDFNTYCRIANLDRAVAIQKVKNTAMSYNDTFWRNFEELKIYLDTHPGDIRTIEGKNIVTIKKDRLDRNNRVYSYLYNWLYAMNGYSTHGNYGFVAHQRPGSVEYEALSELGVSFDDRLNEEALNERLRSSIKEKFDTDGRSSEIMDF